MSLNGGILYPSSDSRHMMLIQNDCAHYDCYFDFLIQQNSPDNFLSVQGKPLEDESAITLPYGFPITSFQRNDFAKHQIWKQLNLWPMDPDSDGDYKLFASIEAQSNSIGVMDIENYEAVSTFEGNPDNAADIRKYLFNVVEKTKYDPEVRSIFENVIENMQRRQLRESIRNFLQL